MSKRKAAAKPPEEGTLAWIELQIGKAEEGLLTVDQDVRMLVQAVEDLKRHQSWETLFADEPKTWTRLVRERIDPVFARVEFIERLCAGFYAFDHTQHSGRIPRKLVEALGREALAARESSQPAAAEAVHQVPAPNSTLLNAKANGANQRATEPADIAGNS